MWILGLKGLKDLLYGQEDNLVLQYQHRKSQAVKWALLATHGFSHTISRT